MSGVKTIRFKTDIDCIDCIHIIRKVLDNMNSIVYWYLDVIGRDHELTIMGEDIKIEDLIRKINSIGFHLQRV